MGPPETTRFEFPGEDGSWRKEFQHMLACIRGGARPSGGLEDAAAALQIVGRAYGRVPA